MNERPRLALLYPAIPHYRAAQHLRFVREIPECDFWAVQMHEHAAVAWADPPEELRLVQFGRGQGPPRSIGERRRAWRTGGEICRWLEQNAVDGLVVSGWAHPAALRTILWAHRRGLPCFVYTDSNVKGDRLGGPGGRLKRLLLPRLLARTSGVMLQGEYGRQYFDRYGVPRSRQFAVPLEVAYEQYQRPDPAQVEAERERWGLDASRRRIVFSGRLAPVKRVGLLIEAFARIAPQRPDWDLLVIGDGAEGERLGELAEAKAPGRVTFTGFVADASRLGALFNACDLLSLPSEHEPWGLVVNEAAAAGLAIVVSDVVGAGPELVKPGENGAIFRTDDLDDLTRALLEVTDGETIDRMKIASRDVLARFRAQSDCVAGMRNALESVGLLEAPPQAERVGSG